MWATRPTLRQCRLHCRYWNWTFGKARTVVSTPHDNVQKPLPDVLVESRYGKGDYSGKSTP